MTQDFVEKAREAKPIALVCEGTRVAPNERRKNYSEEGVGRESSRVISGSEKLVIATFYGRDVDRMRTFSEVARENERQYVVSTKAALLLEALKGYMDVPKLGEDFLVYARLKRGGRFDEVDYDKWERPFIKHAVNFEYINRHQFEVLLNLDFYNFCELIDIQPDRGGHFIYSMSEPYSEEDLGAEIMQNWLRHFGLRFHQIHASGHCSREEIGQVIAKIEPRLLFPVHTEHPELFKKMAGRKVGKVILPEHGSKYFIKGT
jgi:ribonuclease J